MHIVPQPADPDGAAFVLTRDDLAQIANTLIAASQWITAAQTCLQTK